MSEPTLYKTIISYLYTKAGLGQKPPKYIGADVSTYGSIFESLDEEEKIKLIRYLAWIYANIAMLSRVVWSADFRMKRMGEKGSRKLVDVPDHPFLEIYHRPNEFMTKSYLLEYTIGWLMTSRRGAFWYLAPNENNLDELLEIWPMNSNQVQVLKSDKFVEKFIYYPRGEGAKPIAINPEYVAWFRFGNQYNYWESMPPILAALAPGLIEAGIQKSQDKLYNENRGLPLTLVSLDADLSDPDFEAARSQIKRDWQEESSTIAVTRAGQISVQSLGFTQQELQTLLAQDVTRDQFDAIFFGHRVHSNQLTSGEGLKEMDKILKEQVFYPLLILLQDHIQNNVVRRFYSDGAKARYQDPRTYDRALNIQEKMIDSRWNSPNGLRARDGDAPFDDPPGLEGWGDLPLPLASNASFVAQYFGIQGVSMRDPEKPPEVGNLNDFQDPEALTNQMGRQDEAPAGNEMKAVNEGIRVELKRYRKVAKRNLAKYNNAVYQPFETVIIPQDIFKQITKGLEKVASEAELTELFNQWL